MPQDSVGPYFAESSLTSGFDRTRAVEALRAVWAYALAWLPIESLTAITVRRLVDLGAERHTRHLARFEHSLHGG